MEVTALFQSNGDTRLWKLLLCLNRMETHDYGSYCFVSIEWRHTITKVTALFQSNGDTRLWKLLICFNRMETDENQPMIIIQ